MVGFLTLGLLMLVSPLNGIKEAGCVSFVSFALSERHSLDCILVSHTIAGGYDVGWTPALVMPSLIISISKVY